MNNTRSSLELPIKNLTMYSVPCFVAMIIALPISTDNAMSVQSLSYDDLISKNQLALIKTIYANPTPSFMNPLLNPSLPKYHFQPYGWLSGSNHTDIASNSSLQLTKFTVAAWFRTNMDVHKNFTAFIVNKGGMGSEMPGQNLNYGVWMENGSIVAGFETKNGTNYFARSQLHAYNDGRWHYAAATYSGYVVRLYVDGVEVAFKVTNGAIPDNTGKQPVRIGANSGGLGGLYTGNVDEVRVWNRKLTDSEITKGYDIGLFNTRGQVLYLRFG